MKAVLPKVAILVALTALQLSDRAGGQWPSANGGLASQRAMATTVLDARTIPRLRVLWRFRFARGATAFGAITANPVIVGNTVYIQDSSSSVYALDARTGVLRWEHRLAEANDGPNGLTVVDRQLYTATDTTAFALDATTGKQLWTHRLANRYEQFVAIAPVSDRGRVYYSTQGFPPGGRGAIYALSAATGKLVWRFQTIPKPWPHSRAGGGGAWYPFSVDANGNVYAGTANPAPWGGTRSLPNGGAFSGPALYTDSLIVLAGASGKLLWFDQVTHHDIRDYDFQVSPILTALDGHPVVFGAGKAGRVVAWDRGTHARMWSRAVGTHLHDLGPLPRRPITVCPGFLGGVETPMAYAQGRLFVPVVELCARESAITTPSAFARSATQGKGTLYALDAKTGRTEWQRHLGSAPFGCASVARDAVIVPTYDGHVVAFSTADGKRIWRATLPDGNNSCPAVGRDLLVVAAGAPYPGIAHPRAELVAFGG